MGSWLFESGSDRLEFGVTTEGLGLMRDPEIEPVASYQMFDLPRSDARLPGQDFVRGQTVTLQVEARADHRPLDEVWSELLRVWRGDAVRKFPGRVASLVSDGGLRAYGRPRRVKPDLSKRQFGVIRAELVFECITDCWYGLPVSRTIGFAPSVSGGLPIPAAVPFVLGGGGGEADFTVDVGGEFEAWPVFEISGPITDPYIEVVGVGRLVFRGVLAYDQTLTVDTRPWARWVLRDGAAFPGALSPAGSRLSDMALKPGSYQMFFGGYDPSGTSRMTVTVAPAFSSFKGS